MGENRAKIGRRMGVKWARIGGELGETWREKGQTPQKKRRRGVLVHSLALPHHYGGFTLWFCYINP